MRKQINLYIYIIVPQGGEGKKLETPQAGFEPATRWLTAKGSTTELLKIDWVLMASKCFREKERPTRRNP